MKFKDSNFIIDQLRMSGQLKIQIAETLSDVIFTAAGMIVETIKRSGKIMICGNGGSAADAQHIAAEMVGCFQMDREPLPAIALTTDTSILTSLGNDYGFEEIFSRQVKGLGRWGDLLLGLSTSGGSENILRALKTAKEMKISTIAMVGSKDTPLEKISDVIIKIPTTSTPRIQEAHITIGHILCDYVERSFFQ